MNPPVLPLGAFPHTSLPCYVRRNLGGCSEAPQPLEVLTTEHPRVHVLTVLPLADLFSVGSTCRPQALNVRGRRKGFPRHQGGSASDLPIPSDPPTQGFSSACECARQGGEDGWRCGKKSAGVFFLVVKSREKSK